jgi:type II secretory pathway component PulC
MKLKLSINKFFQTFLIILFVTSNCFAAKNSFFKDKTKIENPFMLRDPFKSPLRKTKQKKISSKESGQMQDGVFTYGMLTQNDAKAISNATLENITVIGVIIGNNRRAVTKFDGLEKNVFLKEGDKIGQDRAVLKAILPGGVIFVEKIINVYGQEEFLETVIPISR